MAKAQAGPSCFSGRARPYQTPPGIPCTIRAEARVQASLGFLGVPRLREVTVGLFPLHH